MPTLTNSREDEKHLVEINNQIFSAMTRNGPNPTTFVLLNDKRIAGRVVGIAGGNNGGDNGIWQYYGEVRIIPEAADDEITLDFMEVKLVA